MVCVPDSSGNKRFVLTELEDYENYGDGGGGGGNDFGFEYGYGDGTGSETSDSEFGIKKAKRNNGGGQKYSKPRLGRPKKSQISQVHRPQQFVKPMPVNRHVSEYSGANRAGSGGIEDVMRRVIGDRKQMERNKERYRKMEEERLRVEELRERSLKSREICAEGDGDGDDEDGDDEDGDTIYEEEEESGGGRKISEDEGWKGKGKEHFNKRHRSESESESEYSRRGGAGDRIKNQNEAKKKRKTNNGGDEFDDGPSAVGSLSMIENDVVVDEDADNDDLYCCKVLSRPFPKPADNDAVKKAEKLFEDNILTYNPKHCVEQLTSSLNKIIEGHNNTMRDLNSTEMIMRPVRHEEIDRHVKKCNVNHTLRSRMNLEEFDSLIGSVRASLMTSVMNEDGSSDKVLDRDVAKLLAGLLPRRQVLINTPQNRNIYNAPRGQKYETGVSKRSKLISMIKKMSPHNEAESSRSTATISNGRLITDGLSLNSLPKLSSVREKTH